MARIHVKTDDGLVAVVIPVINKTRENPWGVAGEASYLLDDEPITRDRARQLLVPVVGEDRAEWFTS